MKLETLAVHVGRRVDPATGAITPSINLSTTFERGADGEYPLGYSYIRERNPNRAALEGALAALEGGTLAFAFASGQAAAAAVLMCLAAGDHVLMADDQYHGNRHLALNVFGRLGIAATFVDVSDSEAVKAALQPQTRLIWVESPSNPLLKIADIRPLADLAHENGALLVVDNTWATPILQRPLELGADVVVHSTTKYIGGHSDVQGGCVVVKMEPNEAFAARLVEVQRQGGAVPSPFDCWLLLRSLPTLPVRVRIQTENARKLAEFLEAHPKIEKVNYPGLASHAGHTVAARQMSDFGGMISFQVRGDVQAAMTVAARLKLITRATSLGGVESLIEHRASIEGPGSKTPGNLLRFSVGLEHVDDLMADLSQALEG